MKHQHAVTKTVIYGVLSAGVYFLLYLFSYEIILLTHKGHWYFILPISIAFIFSILHGNFTSCFWDLLGIKAKG